MSVILDGIGIIAQTPPNSGWSLTPPLGWLLLGLVLCGLEYFLRHYIPRNYRFIALMAGVSSILMSFILSRLGHKYLIAWDTLMQVEGALTLQVLFWMGLAFTFVFWVRPMFYRVKLSTIYEKALQFILALKYLEMGANIGESDNSKVLFFDPRNVPETITSLKSMINSSEGVTQQGYQNSRV